MNDQRKKAPDLRFKGFTDDWEQRKFKESAKRVSDKESNVKLPHIEFESINSGRGTLNKSIDKLSSNKLGVKFQTNDILFGKLRPYLKNWYLAQCPGIAVGDFWVLRANKSSLFIYYLIQTDRFYSISNLTSGSKMPRSDWNLVSNYKFYFPLSMPEEIKIGQTFSILDKVITLQQRKLDLLKQLKKGLLQKMFADKDSKRPILRFGGFTDDWEQCKLGEISSTFSGGTPSASNKSYYGGEIPFIRSAEINQNSTQLYLTKDGLNNSSAKLVKKGTLLYALYGATSGEVGIAQIDGAINQAIMAIDLNNEDTYFVKSWLEKNKGRIISTYLQGGQGNLSAKLIKKLVISLPKIKEQIQISSLISRIDILLTLQQRKITKYNEIKKSLLQQMFI